MMNTIIENTLLNRLAASFKRSPLQTNKIHETDAEIISLANGPTLAVTTDSIAEEISLGLYTDPYLIGWMTVMVNMSDLAAVGAAPIGLLVSEILPPNCSENFLARLQHGIQDACDTLGTFVLGGDTNSGEQLTLTGTAVGVCTNGCNLSRIGCQPGELLYATNRVGAGNAFALGAISAFLRGDASDESKATVPYRPIARLREGQALAGLATSCMDTSDGVIATLDQLMRLNGVGFRLNDDWASSLDRQSKLVAEAAALPPWLLLAGQHGEFELLFTVPEGRTDELQAVATQLNWHPILLGAVIQEQKIELPLYGGMVELDSARIRNLSSETGSDVQKYVTDLLAMDGEFQKGITTMRTTETYNSGENFDLRQVLLRGRTLRLRDKGEFFGAFLNDLNQQKENFCLRAITSPADREVMVIDPYTGQSRTMLMFGSNNYLGLANHPYVRQKAEEAIRMYGVGIGGPPLLNGYTSLHRELEARLAALKGAEDALVFSSGYGTNVGLVTGLMNPDDMVFYDAYSHASFCDGIKMSGVQSHRFPHNSIDRLEEMLESRADATTDTFVGVEGVYSMDGDLAPLDILVPMCKSYGAILLVDDAHGTGVMGSTGRGTAEHFGVEGQVDATMGTFSKAFAVTGGFIAASKPIIDYLRYFARSYMFSASLPPVVIGAVLAGLDVIEREPELLTRLHGNVEYATQGFRQLGFEMDPKAGIIPLRVPVGMDIRKMSYEFHKRGIFVNSVEYPAVPISQQRFRVSLMATHTREDIDRLLEAVEAVWSVELVKS